MSSTVQAFDQVEAEAHPECVDWVTDHICHFLHVERAAFNSKHLAAVTEFLLGDDRKKALFAMLHADKDDNVVLVTNRGHPNQGARRTIDGMCKDVMYFVITDVGKEVTPDNIDHSIIFGVMHDGAAMDAFLRAMQYVYAPTLLNNQKWPESIQKDFNSVTHKFMATLTENANRMKGSTVFYVPLVNLADEEWKRVHEDKELVQTFVTAVIYWTKQIREVVNEKDVGSASESAGPLTEIEYWRARAVDMKNICDQFNRADVKRIVDALAPAKDSKWSVEPFLSLKSDIEAGMQEAIDNLRYLRTLEEPCRELAEADASQIPTMIKPLLQRVHMVFMHSKHYRRERFFRLLRMISNEIVARCRQKIDLEAIFDGNVEQSMVALQESIAAGDAWMSQCRKMLSATAKRYRREKGEQLDIDESIFNEIDGFVRHRCKNLQEVCRGQLQFGFRNHPLEIPADESGYRNVLPCFGGAKGPEIESQLLEIQRAFRSKMDALRKLNYDILDVKATMWSDDFRQFKADLDNLGMMITQVIQSAFDLVATVEGGAELLEAFHYLAKREELENAVDKRKDGVVALFKRELTFVQKELQRYIAPKMPPILWLHPPHAGQAFRALNFRQRIEASHRLLHRLWYLSDSAEKHETFDLFQKLDKNSLDESIKRQYRSWKENIPTDLSRYLEEHVIVEKEIEFGVKVYAVNFPVELQVIFEEARYWSRLGESVPNNVAELMAHYEERLRIYRENVAVAVRAYNNIITSLNAEERDLFALRISFLGTPKVYGQGLTKQTWGSQGVVEYFVKECRIQADKVQQVVDKFKFGVQFISHHCRVIADTLVVSIEKKKVYFVDDFEDKQQSYQTLIKQKLQKAHAEIREVLKTIFDCFRADYNADADVKEHWHSFIAKVEKMIEDALRTMVKKSLQEIARALGSSKEDDKSGGGQLFVLQVLLPMRSRTTRSPFPRRARRSRSSRTR
jgi:dynein heavy chain